MKIAVTGASGFVGRHVLAALRTHGVDVVAVTRDAAHLNGVVASARPKIASSIWVARMH